MLDIRWIRAHRDVFEDGQRRRGVSVDTQALLDLDEAYRAALSDQQALQAARNKAAKDIGRRLSQKKEEEAAALKEEIGRLKARQKEQQKNAEALWQRLEEKLSRIAAIPAADVPFGESEADNREVRQQGTPPQFAFAVRDHATLGKNLSQMHMEAAARISGSRFTVLSGGLARLHRALGQFMLDYQVRRGYQELHVPVIVRREALVGTAQLPLFADDLYQVVGTEALQPEGWLIPTAEVYLTNFFGGAILDQAALPIRLTALTECFRRESGSAGRDITGMIRQHEFSKVEMVAISTPDQARAEQDLMVAGAEGILEALGLAFRTVLLCTGDMGFAAVRTYDIEVWIPSQETYREISSCSTCGDYQARRLAIRYRAAKEDKPFLAHTLNGSGLAVGRVFVAVLENFQQADGSVRIPEVLQPYMAGQQVLKAS